MNKKVLVLIAIVFLLVGCGKNEEPKEIKSGKITCNQMKEIMKEDSNARLIDVRTQEEYDQGHLDNAVNYPYETVVDSVKAINGVDINTKIIVYCKSGNRSGQAYNNLKNAGYKNVYDLGAMSSCQ